MCSSRIGLFSKRSRQIEQVGVSVLVMSSSSDLMKPGPGAAGGFAMAAVWRWPGLPGLRLALAFLAVALAAVGLLAGLTAALTAGDVSALGSQQHADLTGAVTVAAGAAWDRGGSWASADLSPILDLAARTGADVQIRDSAGHPVASSPASAPTTRSPSPLSWSGASGSAP